MHSVSIGALDLSANEIGIEISSTQDETGVAEPDCCTLAALIERMPTPCQLDLKALVPVNDVPCSAGMAPHFAVVQSQLADFTQNVDLRPPIH